MNTHTQPILSWHAKSKVDHSRGTLWYVIGGALSGVMIVYGVLAGQYMVTVVFLLLPAAYYLARKQDHRIHEVHVREDGFELDGRLTPWGECKEFWILQGPGYFELHIAPVRQFAPEIIVQTGETDPYLVRDTLLGFVKPGVGKRERILDALLRFTKL